MVMKADMHYDHMIVALSVVIAVTAATAALWLAFNLRGKWQRFGSAFVMGLAVCGMHYTGMYGVSMTHNHDVVIASGENISSSTLALIIFCIASVIMLAIAGLNIFISNEEVNVEFEL